MANQSKLSIIEKIGSYTLSVAGDMDNYYANGNVQEKDEQIIAEILSLNLKLITLSQQLNSSR